MANIVISELRPVGAELFDGSESFMSDLSDSELDITKGGNLAIVAVVGLVVLGLAIVYNK